MKTVRSQLAILVISSAAFSAEAGSISYQAIPARSSDAQCGITEENNEYTTAVDGGNKSGTARTINGITLDALFGSGQSASADNCTLNALSGTLNNGSVNKVDADGVLKDVLSDMIINEGAADNSQQEVALAPESLKKGTTYDLRVYITPSLGKNRQVNLSFVGDDKDPVETGFFNEDDATTSAGHFSKRDQVYYIDYRYTWDGETTPGITITQKSGSAPFVLYALTNQAAARGGASKATTGGKNPRLVLVDMNRIFKNYSKTKDAESDINAVKNEAKKTYDEKADGYKKALDEINELNRQLEKARGRTKSKLTRERDDKIAAIKKMENEINGFRTTKEKELQEQALEMRKRIVGEITSKITELAGDNADAIIDVSGMSLNGTPVVVHFPAGADRSDEVISALNNEDSSSDFSSLQSFKVGLVNMNDIFKRFAKTKDREATINEAKGVAKTEYDSRADAYKKELGEIDNLSGQARDIQISKVKEMERSINEWRKTREKELQDQALKLRSELVAEMTTVIKAQLPPDDPVILFDSSGNSLNGVPIIVSSNNIPDLSDQVVTALNNGGAKKHRSSHPAFMSSTDLRVACVDMNRAFSAAPEAEQAQKEIADLKAAAESEGAGKTSDAKTKEIQETAKQKREQILHKLTEGLNQTAKAGGYNIVFDSSGSSLNGVPVVILNSNLPDITDGLIPGEASPSQ